MARNPNAYPQGSTRLIWQYLYHLEVSQLSGFWFLVLPIWTQWRSWSSVTLRVRGWETSHFLFVPMLGISSLVVVSLACFCAVLSVYPLLSALCFSFTFLCWSLSCFLLWGHGTSVFSFLYASYSISRVSKRTSTFLPNVIFPRMMLHLPLGSVDRAAECLDPARRISSSLPSLLPLCWLSLVH